MNKKSLLALALLAALPFAVSAQDEEAEESSGPFTISASATLASDYVWRGVSQSQEDFALQGDLTFEHESGIYGGVWGSSVDFIPEDASYLDEDDAKLELDAYIGYAFDITDTLAGDVQIIRYIYPGTVEGINYDYNELIGSLTFNEMITATVGYTNDVFNFDDDGVYVALSGSYGLPFWDLSLDAEVGHFTVGSGDVSFDEDGEVLAVNDLKYMHYSVGLSREFGPVSASLAWASSDDDGVDFYGETADPRLFATVSIATDL
jgi:uncharacterized protein (TIGR02001 family)